MDKAHPFLDRLNVPSHPDDAIQQLHAAIEANQLTPAREGNIINLDSSFATEVMITADIHGHEENFETLLEIADLEHNPQRHLIMQEVCHGGPLYEGRGGDMSHRMLQAVAELKTDYPEQLHFIISNHELAEVTEFPIMKDGKVVSLAFRIGLSTAYGDDSERVHRAIGDFIRSCPIGVMLPGRVLVVHSAPESVSRKGFDPSILTRELTDEDLNEGGTVFRMVWGRDYRPENADAFAKALDVNAFILGHTPADEGYSVPNERQIILDCCDRPAAYILAPLDEPLTHDKLLDCIYVID